MIRAFLFTLIIAAGFIFILLNNEPTVQVRYFMGFTTGPIPLYQLVVGAFIVGMALIGILVFPDWIRLRLEVRRQRKALARIEEEMTRTRPVAEETIPRGGQKDDRNDEAQ